MSDGKTQSVWGLLEDYARSQAGAFTSQEVISWFRRHAPGQATDHTIRVHTRGASWNVGDRAQFSGREPFLTRIDRGLFRKATPDEINAWRRAGSSPVQAAAQTAEVGVDVQLDEWHTEESTQGLLVEWLKSEGWTIIRAANTATREHGVDVVAEHGNARIGVEVKGYPSRFYVTGPKKGQLKVTAPENQAPKWFAHALVPAMKLRQREPESTSVMCFPDFPVYRRLWTETAQSLEAAGIQVWVVQQDGGVEIL